MAKYDHEYDFYLEYLKEKEISDKAKAAYHRHCCTCGKREGEDWVKRRRSRLRKNFVFVHNKKVKLMEKPRPYILDIVNSYTYVCRVCNKRNAKEVEIEHLLEKHMYDIFNCVCEGIDGKIQILVQYLGDHGLNYRQPVTLLAPLHICSIRHSLYCAQELVRYGADLEVKDREMKTPLWYACSLPDRHELVDLLLEAGANPNAHTANSSTCLMAAVVAGEVEYVSMLIKHGVNVNGTMNDGTSALWKAAKLGEPLIVRELLLAKANPTICNDKAISPIDNAIKRRNLEPRFELCVQLLQCSKISELAKINIPDDDCIKELVSNEDYDSAETVMNINSSNNEEKHVEASVEEYYAYEENTGTDDFTTTNTYDPEEEGQYWREDEYYQAEDAYVTPAEKEEAGIYDEDPNYPWEYFYDKNGYGKWYNKETGEVSDAT